MTVQPRGRDRWLFHCRYDQLVHSVLAAYGTRYEQRDVPCYPLEGITECGTYVHLISGTPGTCREGIYVNDDHFPTCIRCASGVSTDGISFRQTAKNDTFARVYGARVNYPIQGSASYAASMKQPNIQQLPRGLSYSHVVHDEAVTISSEVAADALAYAYAQMAKPSKP